MTIIDIDFFGVNKKKSRSRLVTAITNVDYVFLG